MTYWAAHWRDIFQASGAMMGVVGAFLMANQYTNLTGVGVVARLVAALWQGKSARTMANVERFTDQNRVATLQGLAFIALGFLIQVIPSIASLF